MKQTGWRTGLAWPPNWRQIEEINAHGTAEGRFQLEGGIALHDPVLFREGQRTGLASEDRFEGLAGDIRWLDAELLVAGGNTHRGENGGIECGL